MSQWTVTEPDRISIDEPVTTVRVGIVGGAINIVGGAEGPVRLEVSEHEGDPLEIRLDGGVLTVGYPQLPWPDFMEKLRNVQSVKYFLSSLRRKRRAVVSIAVPSGTEVMIGTASADATVSRIDGRVSVNSASGVTTLVDVAGRIDASTVSGDIDSQAIAGELRVNSVSGALTVVAGTADKVMANSVSGAVTLDLDVSTPTDIKVTTVTGPVGIRLPSLADTRVEAGTTSGDLISTFDELTVGGTWGARRLSGQLGAGSGRLQVTSVSGAVTVLRRPDQEDDDPAVVHELPAAPADAPPSDQPPADEPDARKEA